MTEQLHLEAPTERSYALDPAAREAGRRGLAKARAALADARARHARTHEDQPAEARHDHPVAA